MLRSRYHYLVVEAIGDDVILFASGLRGITLEVEGVNFAMLREAKLREFVESYATALNSLTSRVQPLVRTAPLNLALYHSS